MRVKLLYVPRAHRGVYGPPVSRIPLLATPVLKALFEKRGIKTEIDDLDIKVDSLLRKGKKGFDLGLLLDVPRVKRYLVGQGDQALDEFADSVLKLTKTRGFDLFGFTVADEWNVSAQTAILVLSKYLQRETGAYCAAGGADVFCMRNTFSIEEIMSGVDFISFESPQVSPWRFLEVLEVLNGKRRKPEDPLAESKEQVVDNYGKGTLPFHLSARLAHIAPYLSAHPEMEESTRFLECITAPDFRGLPLDLYRTVPADIRANFGIKRGILVLPYMFTINCPFNCIFCGRSADNNTFTCKQPEQIAEELSVLNKEHKTRYFRFINDNINPTREFSERLIAELKQRDLDLRIFDMANLFHLDERILRGFYDVGVRGLSYGLETPNEDLLTYVRKGVTLPHAEKMLRTAHKLGIWNEIQLLCGLPFETDGHIERTLSFMKEYDGIINFYLVHKFKLIHSDLLVHPKRHRITNVRLPPQADVQGWAFDEVGGLKWEEKYEQIQRSHLRISRLAHSLAQKTNYSSREDESVIRLHLLYDLLGDKKDIMAYLRGEEVLPSSQREGLLGRALHFAR